MTGKGKKTKIERVWTLALVRLLADGSLDESFDGDGKALVEMNIIQASALVLQAGKIVAVAPISVKNSGKGKAGRGSNYAMAVVRFHATGALDTEAMFYLRSRGLDGEAATSLLIEAFVGEVVELEESPAVRAHLWRFASAWLGGRKG